MNKVPQVVLGVVWFMASLMLIIYSWYIIVGVGDLFTSYDPVTEIKTIEDTTFYSMYWFGVFAMIFVCAILPAYWLIISAFNESQSP